MSFKQIIVHPGTFHADDVCAVAYAHVQLLLMEDAEIERRMATPEDLQDPEVLVLDVGGQYDPTLGNFDHHQKGGAGVRDSGVPYSSFGLLVKEYPPEMGDLADQRFIDSFVAAVDAVDCGWGTSEGTRPQYGISQAISSFNPRWYDKSIDINLAFQEAVAWARTLVINLTEDARAWTAAREVVLEAVSKDRVLILPVYAPWQEHIINRNDKDELLYVIYPSLRGGFNVQQIPKEPDSFEGRKPLPEAWSGLRGQELAEASGVIDATFCHPGRFIAGAESLEGVLALATKAVKA